ncbi:NUDIX domain-containing protein [Shouchella patagoniensis]|uniref:NUDIX domain-containing protein n=1 Tax=Shouchella patagoniensis TaxID=228576 RepID=UPI001FED290D|nr:NUDIX domain-containing protein [Shouchella patagoniensis]
MQIYEDWNGHNVKLTWMPNHVLSSEKVITSVHGLCLYQGLVLLVNIKGRGFNYPGGHIEDGESPIDALHREVYEEGYVKGEAIYIGAIEVSH